MLNDFFRINMPYGIEKRGNGWTAFNREYLPLGCNSYSDKSNPVYTEYIGLGEKTLLYLGTSPSGRECVHRDINGQIYKVWLYHDGTNPQIPSREQEYMWDEYIKKIKKLSKLRKKC